jgi:hypothetical protein
MHKGGKGALSDCRGKWGADVISAGRATLAEMADQPPRTTTGTAVSISPTWVGASGVPRGLDMDRDGHFELDRVDRPNPLGDDERDTLVSAGPSRKLGPNLYLVCFLNRAASSDPPVALPAL